MTKQFEEAIESLRELSDDDQDAAAEILLAYLSSDARIGNDQVVEA